MKTKIAIFIGLFCIQQVFSQSKKKVLFIGNSYTYANNLPQMVADMANSKSDTVQYDSSTPGGYTFQMHCSNTVTWQKIRSQKWDVVVLQAQSQEPAFSPSQVYSQTFPYAKQLCDSIRKSNPCSEIMFYMTWGRKNGDLSNCSTYSPVCTYNGMQARLRESYTLFKDSFMTSMAPVGVAWKNFRITYPLIDLYVPDESHPSVHGTYLTACVFYSSIFKKTTVGSSYYSTIPSTEAVNIQTIASQTVLDSILVWNLGSEKPQAAFSFTVLPGNACQFYNSSKNASSYNWSFGSTQSNPTYTFASSGTYTVQLKAINGCTSDSVIKTVTISGIKETGIYAEPKIKIENKQIYLDFSDNYEIKSTEIYDINGRIIFKNYSADNKFTIDFMDKSAGVYLLNVRSGNNIFKKKLIIDGY